MEFFNLRPVRELGKKQTERRRREARGAHRGRGLGRGQCPLPRIFFFDFWSGNGEFWCILNGILCVLDHRHVILAVGDSTRRAMSLFIWLPEKNTSHNVVTWRLFSVLLYNLTILFEKNILQSFVCEMRVRWPYLIVISASGDWNPAHRPHYAGSPVSSSRHFQVGDTGSQVLERPSTRLSGRRLPSCRPRSSQRLYRPYI